MNLYEINDRIMEAFDAAVDPETGEIIDSDAYQALNDLQMQFDEKAEGILLWIKNLRAQAEALKKEKQAFESRQQAAERKAESLKQYISNVLKGEKFSTEIFSRKGRDTSSIIPMSQQSVTNMPSLLGKVGRVLIVNACKHLGDKIFQECDAGGHYDTRFHPVRNRIKNIVDIFA